MKKFLLSIGLISAFSVQAQYTITSASNPVVGNVESTVATNTTGLNQPASGVNQLWNYSNITNSTTVSSATYVAMSSVPNASLFSGASIASTNDGLTFEVSQITSNQINYLGTAVATPTDCDVWSNPATLMQTPFTMNSFYSDAFALSNSSYTLTGNIAQTGTGTGTLNLPGSTHNNVLKVTSILNYTITGPGFVVTLKSSQQHFYGSSSKFALFSINSQTTTQNGATSSNVNATMNAALIVGIKEISNSNLFSIYPNPATSKQLTISLSNYENSDVKVTLLNTLGDVIKESTYTELLPGENTLTLDLTTIATGIYFVKVKTGNSESIKKLIIE